MPSELRNPYRDMVRGMRAGYSEIWMRRTLAQLRESDPAQRELPAEAALAS